jgi:hypothetical protein
VTDLLTVEVFPVSPDRWVAVADAPTRSFSAEASAPGRVEAEVRRAIEEALHLTDAAYRLVDLDGSPWSPASAPRQLAELEDTSFVSCLSWRSSGPVTETDLDRLVARLNEHDQEVCLQYPRDGQASYVVSLVSMAADPYVAAVECVDLLLAAAAALEIDVEVVEAAVYSDYAQSQFGSADLNRRSGA